MARVHEVPQQIAVCRVDVHDVEAGRVSTTTLSIMGDRTACAFSIFVLADSAWLFHIMIALVS